MVVNGLRLAALAALAVGLALLGYAAVRGDLRFGLFLIFPFVYGTGGAAALGTLVLMAAGVLWFVSLASGAHADSPRYERPGEIRSERRSGGVVLIGPIPIVWGERGSIGWMIAAGAALLVLALVVTWALR